MSTVPTALIVWFITGCSTGIGKLLAFAALKRGDQVIATARKLSQLDDLKEAGASVMQLDVTDTFDNIKAKAKEAEAIHGHVDVVVNNAGFGVLGTLEEVGAEGLMIQYKVNVFGMLNVTNAFLPYMRSRKDGTIVLAGSRSGWRSMPLLGAYGTSKAAVNSMGEVMALELAPFNIRVLTLIPGGYHTDSTTGNPTLKNPGNSYPGYVDIDDYAPHRARMQNYLDTFPGSQPGDPKLLAEVIVDVIRGEGVMKTADGSLRKWPERLVMGSDAERDIRGKMESYSNTMTEWKDVLSSTDLKK